MKINPAPSPNFDKRQRPVTCVVLHYTGMETGSAALDRLRDPDAKVSSHYLVEEDGTVFQLVQEDKRAWHAGISNWRGETDLNSAAIGIEIVNGGHEFGLPDFPETQMEIVINLTRDIVHRYSILPADIVGHSDIAPARKEDPGEKFPWRRLAEEGLGLWPTNASSDQRVLFEARDRDRGIAIAQSGLGYIGYGVEVTGVLDDFTQQVVKAFQRRYRPQKLDGNIDMQTMDMIRILSDKISINSMT